VVELSLNPDERESTRGQAPFDKDFFVKNIETMPDNVLIHLQNNFSWRANEALAVCGAYDGTERAEGEVIEAVSAVEDWMSDTFGEATRLPDDAEQLVFSRLLQKNGSVGAFLDMAAENFKKLLKAGKSNVETVKLPFPFLPPKKRKMGVMPGVTPFVPPKFVDKLNQLIVLLNNNGVFSDDIIVYESSPIKGTARRVGYCLVDIPKKGVQILVCDQEQEKTFFVHGRIAGETLASLDKEELIERFGSIITPIYYSKRGSWERKIVKLLSKHASGEKVPVPEFLDIAAALRKKYTLEQWMAIGYATRRELEVNGKLYCAILAALGVSHELGSPFSEVCHLKAAEKIYGTTSPELPARIKKLTSDMEKQRELGKDASKWRAEIKRKYSLREWPKHSRYRNFEMFGVPISRLYAYFLGKPLPQMAILPLLELAIKIFEIKDDTEDPEERSVLEMYAKEKKAANLFRIEDPRGYLTQLFVNKYTPETWIESFSELKKNNCSFMFPSPESSIGFSRALTVFGIDNTRNRENFLRLGRAIFGEGTVIDAELEKLEKGVDIEELKRAFREKYPAETVGTIPGIKIKVGEYTISTMRTLFGVEGDPHHREVVLKIFREIYPPEEFEKFIQPLVDREEIKKTRPPGEWAKKILEKYSYETLSRLPRLQRKSLNFFEIDGLGLAALSTIFGIVSDSPSSDASFALFLEKIKEYSA